MINIMNALTVKDLRKELKIAFKENNEFIFKRIKSSEVSIKKYIGEYVGDGIDKVLGAMQEMFDERDIKIEQLSKDVSNVKQDIKFMHQDLKDLEVEFSTKPSRKQFEELKTQIGFA